MTGHFGKRPEPSAQFGQIRHAQNRIRADRSESRFAG
jgi:hypothetical protein